MIDYVGTIQDHPDVAKLILYTQQVLKETVEDNPWIPFTPFPKQALFLASSIKEQLYGGALAGGKSQSLLAAAAQYVDRPNYRAIIIRSTISELQMPGALIERSQKWWGGTAARYNSNLHRWKFPSGAEIWFGYLGSKNWSRYQSSEWDFVGFDELVTIPQRAYNILYGRVRQSLLYQDTADVPPRVRAASNPPTAEQEATGWWVKEKFVDKGFPYFIQATASDNPYITPDYLEGLRQIYDPITFEKLANGDWSIRAGGSLWRRDMMPVIPRLHTWAIEEISRGWDLAATKPNPDNPDPDWTRGVKIARVAGIKDYDYVVTDMVSMRDEPSMVANMLYATAAMDQRHVRQVIPQDPGQAGKAQKDYLDYLLRKFAVSWVRESKTRGGKVRRATPFAIAAGNDRVRILHGPWNREFYEELESMPEGKHDDIMDAAASAFNDIAIMESADVYDSGFHEAYRYRPVTR